MSPYIVPKIRRHLSGEMHLSHAATGSRPTMAMVECVANWQELLHIGYISDICRATSVSGADDQTPDSYTAVYNAKNSTSLVGGNASHACSPALSLGTARYCGGLVTNHDPALHVFGIICGDIGVGSLIVYAGNGCSSTGVADICEVAPVSWKHCLLYTSDAADE